CGSASSPPTIRRRCGSGQSVSDLVTPSAVTVTVPASAGSSPANTRSSVLLPAPLGPTIAIRRPGGTSMSTPASAGGASGRYVRWSPRPRRVTGPTGASAGAAPVAASSDSGGAAASTAPTRRSGTSTLVQVRAAASNPRQASTAPIAPTVSAATHTPGAPAAVAASTTPAAVAPATRVPAASNAIPAVPSRVSARANR